MSHTITAPYVFTHTPQLRPAFDFDLFKKNKSLKSKLTIWVECLGCNKYHPLNFQLPKIHKGDAPEIIAANKQIRNNCAVELQRKLDLGELYVSSNNIGFEISLNIN